ncbi:MAG TPA: 50S ribosomal protein L4 [Nitrospirae bacterium]|nr:50S ribosomal protein L4 [bacterium BMS3Abin06]HDH13316.1 50S ribosomal protein L4 [Nitrospirota bacterium]HDZ00318.1 50S ribosomal protein L4 [Nitrospirota bacterium]
MAQIEIINNENKSVGKADLPDDIFGVDINKGLLHEVVRNHLANKRQGTASTKTKGLVRGGGRKPYKQKGTGRARAGSIRSPLWKGGGTVFGPRPRDYSYKLPKKVKWTALSSALSAKYADGEVIVIDDLTITEPRTKAVKGLLDSLGLKNNVLIIVPEKNAALELAARNIPAVNVARVNELNVYAILSHKKLLISRDAVERMKEAYLG